MPVSSFSLPPENRPPRPGWQFLVYGLLGIVALLARWACAPSEPFFGDVPVSVEAMESGRMYIQFPGYVPFHLIASGLAFGGGALQGLVIWNGLCGMIFSLYLVLIGERLAGFRGGVALGVFGGLGLCGVYFSVVGSSYICDALAVAGVVYHGLRVLHAPQAGAHLWWAMVWCGVGFALRPLSGMWVFPAVAWLAWSQRGWHALAGVILFHLLVAALYVAVSVPFHGSLAALLESLQQFRSFASGESRLQGYATNLFRVVAYPAYFFQVWLLFGGLAWWGFWRRKWSEVRRDHLVFWTALILPYLAVLLRHTPQAGYLCFLAPIVATLPFLSGNQSAFFRRLTWAATAAFLVIALLQIFVFRPVKPRSMLGLVADAYFLQYSRAGIVEGRFDTLSSLALREGIGRDQVPESRRAEELRRIEESDNRKRQRDSER